MKGDTMSNSLKRMLAAITGAAALAVGGAAIADAAGSGSSSSTAAATTTAAPSAAVPSMPAHGSASHEDAEKAVTGAAADKAKAAAVAYLGGGTAGDVTSDFQGSGYEVTVTKSDGTSVELHLDSSFNAMQFGAPGGSH
jgi:hypothetical protein